jgi:magnesium transporter
MGKVIGAAAYSAGRKVADIAIKESGQWAAKPDHFVWIGIHQPDERELRELQAQFHLHDLAIEDALHAHQRPKLEQYGDTTFLVVRTAFLADGHIELGETEIFVGRGYIISIRHGASASYARVRNAPRPPLSDSRTGKTTSSMPSSISSSMTTSRSLVR